MDRRLEKLIGWLKNDIGMGSIDIAPASEDASFRRYFRVSTGDDSLIVMDAPPDKEDCHPYIEIARAFGALGLNVPRVLQSDLSQGFLLLTDLGTRQYLSALNEARAAGNDKGDAEIERLYHDAFDSLLRLQCANNNTPMLPLYDRALLMSEMQLFRDWFLKRHLSLALSAELSSGIDRVYRLLADNALEQPQTWVHRDYHSRNLMVVDDNNPGILDFQDAVTGPVTYDLVSLLRDCYIQWATGQVDAWAKEYFRLACSSDLLAGVDEAKFIRWFDLMGVQRHLKAVGIFARLRIRDNKPGYLNDIPRTLDYVREVSSRYPELSVLHDLLINHVIPALKDSVAEGS